MLFSFDVFKLNNYIRSGCDPVLQSILQILRKDEITSEDTNYIADCIRRHCHFADSWDDLPDHVVRTVSKKSGKDKVIDNFISKIKNNSQIRSVDCIAINQVQQGDSWVPTSARKTIKILNKQIYYNKKN